MKKVRKPLMFSLLMLCFMLVAQTGMAQAPPPPPLEKGTNTNNAPGGNAPVEGGLLFSLALVAGFGAWKLFKGKPRNFRLTE
jgi:hypothetical protein